MERIADTFFSPQAQTHDTRVAQILQEVLPQIKQQLGYDYHQSPADVCLLADAGQTIIHLLGVLAKAATCLSHGDTIADYVENRLVESAEDRELDDLDMEMVDYLEDKHAALK